MNKTILELGFLTIGGGAASATVMLILFDFSLKGSLLVLLALVASLAAFKATAATRHLILATALIALLALPMFSLVIPNWNILPANWNPSPELSQLDQNFPRPMVPTSATSIPTNEMVSVLPPDTAQPVIAESTPPAAESQTINSSQAFAIHIPTTLLVATWLCGVLICLLPLLVGFLRLRRLSIQLAAETSHSTANCLQDDIDRLAQHLKIRSPRLLLGDNQAMPMVWQFWNSYILLPGNSNTWTAERKNVVLLHELKHLKRRDHLSLVLCSVARAIHWFNPLVWLAFHQMKIERERACDDFVLQTGVFPDRYATHLLELATTLTPSSRYHSVALSMAAKSQVESRLNLILNQAINRRKIGIATIAGLILAAFTCSVTVAAIAFADRETNSLNEDEIKWPFCELNLKNLDPRPIEEAIETFQSEAATNPIGSTQEPLAKQEILDAIKVDLERDDLDESVRSTLEEILETETLTSNSYLRRFTRFDDSEQMHGVWWVKLIVERDSLPPQAITVRADKIYSRPYTQMERWHNSINQTTLLNRFSSYYKSLPTDTLLTEDLAGRSDRFAGEFKSVLEADDKDKMLEMFDWTDVADSIQSKVSSELDTILAGEVETVVFQQNRLAGAMAHWQAFQTYVPNRKVAGYIKVEFRPEGNDNLKTIWLEAGKDESSAYKLVNYVASHEIPVIPERIEPEMSISSGIFQANSKLPVESESHSSKFLMTWNTTNPGELLSAHLANEEIWLRQLGDESANDDPADELPAAPLAMPAIPLLPAAEADDDDPSGEAEADDDAGERQDGRVPGEAMPEQIWIDGQVVDAETGEAIEQNVIVQAGKIDEADPTKITWGYSESRSHSSDGSFTASVKPANGWTARVIVAGYLPQPIDLDSLPAGVARPEIELKLRRGKSISGTVVDHEGNPVSDINVFAVSEAGLNLFQGEAWAYGQKDPHTKPQQTDSQGNFSDLVLSESRLVAVSSPSFSLWTYLLTDDEFDEDNPEIKIQLPQPGTLIINYDQQGAPEPGTLLLQFLSYQLGESWKGVQLEQTELEIGKGQFKLEGLPPGPYQVYRSETVMFTQIGMTVPVNRTFFEIEAGKTITLDWTTLELGTQLLGKVSWDPTIELQGIGFRIEKKTAETVEGGGRSDWPFNVDGGKIDMDSGEFKSIKIPPGKYTIHISAYKPIPEERMMMSGRIGPSYTKTIEIEVPEEAPDVTDLEIKLDQLQ